MTMRETYPFNHHWLYTPQAVTIDAPDSDFEPVILPHTNKILPHQNFDDHEYQFISTYRKRFTLPQAPAGRRVMLDFAGVLSAATVTINGHSFTEHRGGFVPFSYDISDYLDHEGENLLTVTVDSRERHDIPPFGGRVDYLVFGGIYRDVTLRYVDPVHIHNVRVRTLDTLSDQRRAEIDVWIHNTSDEAKSLIVYTAIATSEHSKRDAQQHRTIAAHTSEQVTLTVDCRDCDLWTLDGNPPFAGLYDCSVMLLEHDDAQATIDNDSVTVGFRTAQFREDGFYLNREKVFLRGLNRHQMYPFVGAAVSRRLQARDADLIKSYGCNIVRTSHYPQDKAFLRRCDEIGLLVFEEIPGWQHIGDEDWQALALRDVRAMIERDWNHASIILWGVRINESWDNTAFYTRTNALAHELDPTRQTGGVRFWPHSEFLEDVYTYNDFSDSVIEPTHSPWLITEFNGHMFPTKAFDHEARQSEHMTRHAKIQSQAMATGGIAGAIGWCAFDYNTHSDFGSGDRVCYHGVLDMFRQPKWAGWFYRSQKSPAEEIVLQAATFWTMGDRSAGGVDPFYVMTNVDYIDVYVGGEFKDRYTPASDEFPYLPHPPIKVTRVGTDWGSKWEALRIVGFIDGEEVAEQRISQDGIPRNLEFYAEDTDLQADGRDMTRLVFRITDEYGNRLPYAIQPVMITLLEGDAEVIGSNPFALVGGQAALFLKAGTTASTVRLRAHTPRLDPIEIIIETHNTHTDHL